MPLSAVFPWTVLQKHACLCHLGALFSSDAKADWKQKTKKKQLDQWSSRHQRAALFPDSLAIGSSEALLERWQETETTETSSSSLVRISKHGVETRGFLCLRARPTYCWHQLTLHSNPLLTANFGVVYQISNTVNFYCYLSQSYSASGGSKEELTSPTYLCTSATHFIVSKALTGTSWSQFTQIQKTQKCLNFTAVCPSPFPLGVSLCALRCFYPFPLVPEVFFPHPSPCFFSSKTAQTHRLSTSLTKCSLQHLTLEYRIKDHKKSAGRHLAV